MWQQCWPRPSASSVSARDDARPTFVSNYKCRVDRVALVAARRTLPPRGGIRHALAPRFPRGARGVARARVRARSLGRGARPAPSARAPLATAASRVLARRRARGDTSARPLARTGSSRSPPRPSPRAPPRPKRRTRGGRRRPRARPRSTAPRRARSTWRRSGSDSRPPRSDPSTRDDPPASKPTASASSSPHGTMLLLRNRPRRTPCRQSLRQSAAVP